MVQQENRLINHTIIYGIGNIGTKILAYVMVLVYSYYIKSEELGYYDLVLTTVSMLQPLVILGIAEATFRFMIDNTEKGRREIVATSSRFIICTLILAGIVFGIIGWRFNVDRWQTILLYGFTTVIYTYNQEAVRGYEKPQLYATIGIINSVITLLLEFVGFIIFHGGIGVLFKSTIVANTICIVILLCKTRILSDSISGVFNKIIFSNMLHYSLPLVPNAMCWWVMNSSDRYVIRIFIGAAANGIYAISYKFPTIFTTISTIFYLAWQESAVREYNSDDRDIFFSKVFNSYFRVLFSLVALLLPFTRIIVTHFVSIEYRTAWIYSCPLIISAAFGALCSFHGIAYQVAKDTLKALYTVIFAAAINVISDLALVGVLGIHAASYSTLLAFMLLYIIRAIHSKEYYTIFYDWKNQAVLCIVCLVSYLVTLLAKNNMFLYLFCGLMVFIVVAYNYRFIQTRILRVKD